MDSLVVEEGVEDSRGGEPLDSFPEEKSPVEKASKKTELEVNPNPVFDYDYLAPLAQDRFERILFLLEINMVCYNVNKSFISKLIFKKEKENGSND